MQSIIPVPDTNPVSCPSDAESATTLVLGNFQSAVVLDMGVLKARTTTYGVLNFFEVLLHTQAESGAYL